MNISFDKIDSFKEIIEEAKAISQSDKCTMAMCAMKLHPEMRRILVEINNSDKSKEEKQRERIEYFINQWKLTNESAIRHGFSDIQALAESRMKQLFNEELFLKTVLNTLYKISMCRGYDLTKEEGITGFIKEMEISIGTRVNRVDIISIAQIDIPRIKDIEAEFWNNCPTPSDVERMCNFYYGRLSGCIDTDTINWFFQRANDKHPNLEEMVLCGLLDEDSLRIIKNCFITMHCSASGLCREITTFLNKLLPPVQQSAQPQQTSNIYLSTKKGMKIDYIRIINCLYELGFFVDEKQNTVNKIDVMKAFGSITNKDLKNYDKDLSRALSDSTALTKNLEIFDILKEKMTEIFNSK